MQHSIGLQIFTVIGSFCFFADTSAYGEPWKDGHMSRGWIFSYQVKDERSSPRRKWAAERLATLCLETINSTPPPEDASRAPINGLEAPYGKKNRRNRNGLRQSAGANLYVRSGGMCAVVHALGHLSMDHAAHFGVAER